MDKAARGETLTKHERSVVSRGGYFTASEAEKIAKKLADDGRDYVPVRAHSATLSAADRAALQLAQDPIAMATAHQKLLSDRVVRTGDGHAANARNVVLMPAHEYGRLVKHLAPAGSIEKAAQLMNAPFRMAVLPQPRWLTGNFIEPYLVRLPLKGAGVNVPGLIADTAAQSRLLRHMERSGDPALREAAKAIRAQQLGGLFIGRRGASVHRTFEDFEHGTPARRALYVAHILRNLPVTKQLADLVLVVPKAFFAFNRVLEPTAQRQALGKSIRNDIQAFTGSWTQSVFTTKKVLEQVARGTVDTATLQRWMKEQHDLLGQYEGFGPGTRRLVQSGLPFLPWSLAAARFVYMTLPLHHTGAEVLLLKAAQVNQQQFADQHADVPPGTLKVAQVGKDGGLTDIARYTPFGLTVPLAEGELGGVTDPLLPQLSGIIAALGGNDPFGRPLKVQPTEGNPKGAPSLSDKAGIAINTALEATVPMLAMGRRLQEHGGTAFGNSTVLRPKVKPGSSHMSAVRRTLDPFRPTYLKSANRPNPAMGWGGSSGTAHPGWGYSSGGASSGWGYGSGGGSSRTAAPGWGY